MENKNLAPTLDRDFITFGTELEFTSPILESADAGPNDEENAPENRKARDDFKKLMEFVCKDSGKCRISKKIDQWTEVAYQVPYDDGYFFEITVDPGVVEIKLAPATVSSFVELTQRIERDIYQNASRLGLSPNPKTGSQHVHIGAKVFMENPTLFRNFIVDFANHSELAAGVFEYNDLVNAPPIAASREKRDAFERIIGEFDSGKIKGTLALAKKIQSEVYLAIDNHLKRADAVKYQAMSFARMLDESIPDDEKTIEIRSIEAQKTYQGFLKIIRLLENRLIYLATLKEPILYSNRARREIRNRLKDFQSYVKESGLRWIDYRGFILKLIDT